MYAHNTISLVHPLISVWAWQALEYSMVSYTPLQAPGPEPWKFQCTDSELTPDRPERARVCHLPDANPLHSLAFSQG